MSPRLHNAAVELPLKPRPRLVDLVVPYTTPPLTRAALEFCDGIAADLQAHIRLIRIQLVPFPAPLDTPPVAASFLREQMMQFTTRIPCSVEVLLARSSGFSLRRALQKDSLVVLATRRRPWRTREQRLARALQTDGYRVVLVRLDVLLKGSHA